MWKGDGKAKEDKIHKELELMLFNIVLSGFKPGADIVAYAKSNKKLSTKIYIKCAYCCSFLHLIVDFKLRSNSRPCIFITTYFASNSNCAYV